MPTDGRAPANTGLVQRFREAGLFTVPTGVAWVDDSLVFSAAGPPGVNLYRQHLVPPTFQPAGAPEQLTAAGESAWFPTAAAGRLAFLSSHADANLWSLALDAAGGLAKGPLRRMTRGPAPLGYLTVTTDFRTLAYFSYRLGDGDVFLRDLQTGSEKAPFRNEPIPESAWVMVDRSASHPFWSAAGRLLYYTPTGTNPLVRRPFARDISAPHQDCWTASR